MQVNYFFERKIMVFEYFIVSTLEIYFIVFDVYFPNISKESVSRIELV